MNKQEYIERYGQEWYEQYKARKNAQCKERYQNDPKFRESKIARDLSYIKNELNSAGKTKNSIRHQSSRILFDKRHHSKLKGYEIHHAFGYEDPHKFIYIPKVLHTKIHQFLRDNNIDADSNHFSSIAQLINECPEYTYVSA